MHTRKNNWLGNTALGLLLCGLMTSNALAAVYSIGHVWDWQSDFAAVNPAPDDQGTPGVWAYQYNFTGTALSTRAALGTYDGTANDWYQAGTPYNVPAIWGPSTSQLHPGVDYSGNNINVILSWTSPVTGPIRIAGTIFDNGVNNDPGAGNDGVNWSIDAFNLVGSSYSNLANGSVFDPGAGYTGPYTIHPSDSVNQTVWVNVGDKLLFTVDPKLTIFADATGYNVTYTLLGVPEPTTISLLAFGGWGLLSLHRRRRAKKS